ncbi:hypothetical protein VTH06DRAFT_6206 [Thermothelomyces fergusii]
MGVRHLARRAHDAFVPLQSSFVHTIPHLLKTNHGKDGEQNRTHPLKAGCFVFFSSFFVVCGLQGGIGCTVTRTGISCVSFSLFLSFILFFSFSFFFYSFLALFQRRRTAMAWPGLAREAEGVAAIGGGKKNRTVLAAPGAAAETQHPALPVDKQELGAGHGDSRDLAASSDGMAGQDSGTGPVLFCVDDSRGMGRRGPDGSVYACMLTSPARGNKGGYDNPLRHGVATLFMTWSSLTLSAMPGRAGEPRATDEELPRSRLVHYDQKVVGRA